MLVDGVLADHLDDGRLRSDIEVHQAPSAPKPHYAPKRDAYLETPVPGAVFVDWTEDITEPAAPVHDAGPGLQGSDGATRHWRRSRSSPTMTAAAGASKLVGAQLLRALGCAFSMGAGTSGWRRRPVGADRPARSGLSSLVQPGWRAASRRSRTRSRAGPALVDCGRSGARSAQ